MTGDEIEWKLRANLLLAPENLDDNMRLIAGVPAHPFCAESHRGMENVLIPFHERNHKAQRNSLVIASADIPLSFKFTLTCPTSKLGELHT